MIAIVAVVDGAAVHVHVHVHALFHDIVAAAVAAVNLP